MLFPPTQAKYAWKRQNWEQRRHQSMVKEQHPVYFLNTAHPHFKNSPCKRSALWKINHSMRIICYKVWIVCEHNYTFKFFVNERQQELVSKILDNVRFITQDFFSRVKIRCNEKQQLWSTIPICIERSFHRKIVTNNYTR